MSKTPGYGSNYNPEDTFAQFLEGAAKLLFWGGLIVTAIATGFLLYTYYTFSGQTNASPDQAAWNIALFSKILITGMVAVGVGSSFLFWGEETLGAFQLIGAALFYFAPLLLPMTNGRADGNLPVPAKTALATIQQGGMIFGVLAIIVLVIDIANRVKLRSEQGARAEMLKYGKGIKKEQDIQNVLMGKCWQLPYCRKYVRERCPIFHSNRTCWKEKVGCMCEEEVIRNAMENKEIPKDPAVAVHYIPVNNKLTFIQKQARCRQCVIYNEHQKHKYKILVPSVLVFYIAFVALFWGPLMSLMSVLIQKIDRVVGLATYQANQTRNVENLVPQSFQIILLGCLIMVFLTYTLKLVEFLIFKAKI